MAITEVFTSYTMVNSDRLQITLQQSVASVITRRHRSGA